MTGPASIARDVEQMRVAGCFDADHDGEWLSARESVHDMVDELPLPSGGDPTCWGLYDAAQVALTEYAEALEEHPDHGCYGPEV